MLIHIITSLDIGGAEQALKKLVLVTRHKHAIKVIAIVKLGPIAEELISAGIEVKCLHMVSLLQFPKAIFSLRRILLKEQPDIVQTWLYHADFIGGVAARLANVKTIIWGVRTTELKKGACLTTCLRKLLAWLSYIVPSKIVCVAHTAKNKHVELGYCAEKMLVIGNGFEQKLTRINNQCAIRKLVDYKPSDILLGTVGRFSQDKAQDLFIEAAGIIANKYPSAKFVLIGRELNKSNAVLNDWINNAGVASRVYLVGERSDVSDWLSILDIFCLPSRTEGFPNVLGEAMMQGVACVATKAGDAEFILSDTGILCAEKTGKGIAQAIDELLSLSVGERYEMGLNARKRIENEFSLAQCTQQYLHLYQNLKVGN